MGNFINESFLLSNKSSKDFFDLYSEKLPIFDFHNHLSPKLIADDYQYNNLGQLWLNKDHYKWRAMRANGVYEQNNNSETDKQRFIKWAETVPKTVGGAVSSWRRQGLESSPGSAPLTLHRAPGTSRSHTP